MTIGLRITPTNSLGQLWVHFYDHHTRAQSVSKYTGLSSTADVLHKELWECLTHITFTRPLAIRLPDTAKLVVFLVWEESRTRHHFRSLLMSSVSNGVWTQLAVDTQRCANANMLSDFPLSGDNAQPANACGIIHGWIASSIVELYLSGLCSDQPSLSSEAINSQSASPSIRPCPLSSSSSSSSFSSSSSSCCEPGRACDFFNDFVPP